MRSLFAALILCLFANCAGAKDYASIYGNGDGYEWKCVAMQLPKGGCEIMDPRELTAAMREPMPLGARVLVTNLNNGHQVTVRINDRGPFIRGRIIDLTPKAARELGFCCDGLAPVTVRRLP